MFSNDNSEGGGPTTKRTYQTVTFGYKKLRNVPPLATPPYVRGGSQRGTLRSSELDNIGARIKN